MSDRYIHIPLSIARSMWLAWMLIGMPSVAMANEHEPAELVNTMGPMGGMSTEPRPNAKDYRVLWPGHRILEGTVETIRSEVVKVNTGELVPRFLSTREAREKGLPPLKKGDKLQLVVNDQNLVIDYHHVGQEVWHRMILGRLAQPLPVGHEWAVIRHRHGKEEAFAVRPLARSKVSAIPVNVPAIFLTDERNKIIDASFGSEEVLLSKSREWKKTPPKAPYRQIEGTLMRSPGRLLIKTPDGREESFEIRPYMQEKLSSAREGASVILLLDDENKVADLAKPPL